MQESSLTAQTCGPGKAVNLWPRWRMASSWLEPPNLPGDESEISECTLACNHPEKSACKLQPEPGWGSPRALSASERREWVSLGCATVRNETKICLNLSFLFLFRVKEVLSPWLSLNLHLFGWTQFILIENASKKQEKSPLYCICPDVGTKIKLKRQNYMQQASMDIWVKTKQISSQDESRHHKCF